MYVKSSSLNVDFLSLLGIISSSILILLIFIFFLLLFFEKISSHKIINIFFVTISSLSIFSSIWTIISLNNNNKTVTEAENVLNKASSSLKSSLEITDSELKEILQKAIDKEKKLTEFYEKNLSVINGFIDPKKGLTATISKLENDLKKSKTEQDNLDAENKNILETLTVKLKDTNLGLTNLQNQINTIKTSQITSEKNINQSLESQQKKLEEIKNDLSKRMEDLYSLYFELQKKSNTTSLTQQTNLLNEQIKKQIEDINNRLNVIPTHLTTINRDLLNLYQDTTDKKNSMETIYSQINDALNQLKVIENVAKTEVSNA